MCAHQVLFKAQIVGFGVSGVDFVAALSWVIRLLSGLLTEQGHEKVFTVS